MGKINKNKIIITVVAVVLMLLILLLIASVTRTGTHESSYSEGVTVNGHINYTLPADYSIQGEDSISFKSPSSEYTVSNESKFTFSGTVMGNYPLSCNGQNIEYSDIGVFSCEFDLVQGVNTFEFTYGSISRVFTVEYGIDVIRQISPTGSTQASSGTVVEILALAHRDSVLYAYIGGKRIEMAPTGRNAFTQSEGTKDYITYEGFYTMPNLGSDASLGKVTVYGEYNGKKSSMTGGEILLLSDNTAIIAQAAQLEQQQNLASYYADGSHGLLTPFADNGQGTSIMCEILKDKTETTPAGDPNDYSCPLYTPLNKGTFDYVSGFVTYDDELMYILSSGRKVYAKDAKLLSSAYSLPSNTVSFSDSVQNAGSTDFYISTRWAVPVNVILAPQDYYKGYQSRVYNVTSFSAQFIDFIFYHTDSFSGSFNLPANDVVSSCQWINNGDGTVTLRMNLQRYGKFFGYSVSLCTDGRMKISVKNKNSVNGKTVILDPGHGGSDPGATGIYNGIYESRVNLAIAGKTADILQKQGINVIMTRTGESDVTLNERMLLARQYSPDAFVSIHSDSSTSASSSGTHTFYYKSYSMPLASAIHTQMLSVYRNNIYIPGSSEYNNADKGINFYPFQVTRVEECPSVLVECGYLSNATDCSVLVTEECQNAIAMAIANGIISYFNSIQ